MGILSKGDLTNFSCSLLICILLCYIYFSIFFSFKGIKKNDVRRGMAVIKPGTFKQYDKVEAQVNTIYVILFWVRHQNRMVQFCPKFWFDEIFRFLKKSCWFHEKFLTFRSTSWQKRKVDLVKHSPITEFFMYFLKPGTVLVSSVFLYIFKLFSSKLYSKLISFHPFFAGYIFLTGGTQMIMPGENSSLTINLIKPMVSLFVYI